MRFDQPGFQTYKKLENVLLKAAKSLMMMILNSLHNFMVPI